MCQHVLTTKGESWSNQGHSDSSHLECSEGLGEVLVVRLENKFPIKEEWFVDFVEVHDFHTSAKKVFPCYHCIRNNDSISFSSSTSKHHIIAIDIHTAYIYNL